MLLQPQRARQAPHAAGDDFSEALLGWIEHQFVLRRKSEHRLNKIADRLELAGGYIIAFSISTG